MVDLMSLDLGNPARSKQEAAGMIFSFAGWGFELTGRPMGEVYIPTQNNQLPVCVKSNTGPMPSQMMRDARACRTLPSGVV